MLISSSTFSQRKHEDFAQKYKGMGALSEIIMSNKCIIRDNFNLFFESSIKKNESERTFVWYKLVFHQPCYISFTIIPNSENDRYGMEVYTVKNNIKICNEIYNNVFTKEDTISKDVIYDDNFQTDSFRNSLYHTRKISVDLDESVFIMIHNKRGPDLGHVIDLQTCDYSYILKVNKEKIISEESVNRKLLSNELSRLKSVSDKICATEPDKKLGYSNFRGEKMGIKNLSALQADSASKEQAKAVRVLDSLAGKKIPEIKKEEMYEYVHLKTLPKDISYKPIDKQILVGEVNILPISEEKKSYPEIFLPNVKNNLEVESVESFVLIDSLIKSIHQAEETPIIVEKSKGKKLTADKSLVNINRIFFAAFDSKTGLIIDKTELKLSKRVPVFYRDSIKSHEVISLNTNKLLIKFSKLGYMPYTRPFSKEHCVYSGNVLYYLVEMHALKTGDKVALSDVLFQPNTTVLKNSSKKELDKLVEYMKSHPVKIRINGHTQGNRRVKNTGKNINEEHRFKGSSWKLSRKRAKKVEDYLISRGIEKSRLSTRGYAGFKPIHRKPKNLSEREENMRVEVEIIGETKTKKKE